MSGVRGSETCIGANGGILTRRGFVRASAWCGLAGAAAIAGLLGIGFGNAALADEAEDGVPAEEPALEPLPPASPDPENMFGVDLNINMETIDQYLNRPDVVYRDMRMIFDPAEWEDVDGDPYLTYVLEGFKIVPFPFLATMAPIPVGGYYEGETLFDVEWDENANIVSVNGNYKESMKILRDLFPRDKAIFLCCGGAGYASFTKSLLVFLGWDPSLIYNVGGMWYYTGNRAIELIDYGRNADEDLYALWRADYALIDFTLMRPERIHYQQTKSNG